MVTLHRTVLAGLLLASPSHRAAGIDLPGLRGSADRPMDPAILQETARSVVMLVKLRPDEAEDAAPLAVSLAHVRELVQDARSAPTFDLSSPTAAEQSCNRALGTGAKQARDCIMWAPLTAAAEQAAARAKAVLTATSAGQEAPSIRAGTWAEWYRMSWSTQAAGIDQSPRLRQVLHAAATRAGDDATAWQREAADLLADTDAQVPATDEAAFERNGLLVEALRGQESLDEVLRLGIKMEAVSQVDADHAWVKVLGTNLDGSPWRYSRLRLRSANAWPAHLAPGEAELSTLPPGWPPPIDDAERVIDALMRAMLEDARSPGD